MQVDIGNNKICHNFTSIVSSAEIRDLNERVQLEHPHEGGGAGLLPQAQPQPQQPQQPSRRVDPNAGVPAARVESNARSARRTSLNLSRSSAGSRHSQHQHRHPHSRSARSPSPDDVVAPPLPPLNSSDSANPRARVDNLNTPARSAAPMAAVVSPNHRPGSGSGGWPDAARNGNSAAAAHGADNNNNHNSNVGADRHAGPGNKSNVENSRRAEEAAVGSQDNNNNHNGSDNPDKPAQPAGPKLAQTKIQLGMRLRRWLIINRIGAGSFGETFTAMEVDGPIAEEDTLAVTPENLALLDHLPPLEERREVCIKVEQENKNVLRLEALALKKVQPCPQVVRYLGSGCTNGMNYLVMEKLGPNLAELRRRSQHGTFNIYTTLKAGISCLTAIRGVHDLGLVHRDIKPSNFVTGLPNTREHTTCYLIDFGLARRFRRSNGEIRPPRDNAGFRGTSRYASVASHHHQELGRVDDLWSLLFMLVEFATGTLPWRKYKDKDDIGRCKEESITPHLVRNLPREFQPFLAHLQTLRYEDEPDYDLLVTLMYRALERRGYPPNKPVEWEMDASMMDSGVEGEGHEAERPNPAPSPAAPASPPAPHAQPSGQDVAGDSAQNAGQLARRAAPQQPAGADSAAKKAALLHTPLSPNGAASISATAQNNRSTPAPGDIVNTQAGATTPQRQNASALRVSEVDVLGGNRATAADPAVAYSVGGAAPGGGTVEEPGGVSVFPADGSETPAAAGSSDDFDPNEFSPREQDTPAIGDRDGHRRSSRPGSSVAAGITASIAAVPPSTCAVEPNNSTNFKDAAEQRSNSGPQVPSQAPPHVDAADEFSGAEDGMQRIGNAAVERPMGGAAVDLDAPNGDQAEGQGGANGKTHAKKKKKSNCDCAVM